MAKIAKITNFYRLSGDACDLSNLSNEKRSQLNSTGSIRKERKICSCPPFSDKENGFDSKVDTQGRRRLVHVARSKLVCPTCLSLTG